VNGLGNHSGSDTDKTLSDDVNDDDAGKAAPGRGERTAANDKNRNNDEDADDDDDDDSDDSDDVVPAVTKPRPAKVIAGEVIKQWQTKTRSKGRMHTLSESFIMSW